MSTNVRLTCPYLGDARDAPCRVDEARRVVTAACGDVAANVPLVLRFDARSRRAEVAARQLRDTLVAWGYSRIYVLRGLTRAWSHV